MLSRPSPITLRNVCNWPPAWLRLGRAHARAAKTITGEIGVLKEVRCYEDRPGRIYLTVDHAMFVPSCCILVPEMDFKGRVGVEKKSRNGVR